MVELDGVNYQIKTPAENTQDMLDRINKYCNDNNIVNSKNEQVYIEANVASPIYLILWAAGYLVTVIQNLIYSLGKGISIQASSDDQLLNLCDIAGLKRRRASLTTFDMFVEAMNGEEEDYVEGVQCTITSSDTITYNGIEYYPAVYPSITLEDGETAYLTFVAKQTGSYSISENEITSFDNPIVNLKRLIQYESVPGQQQESIQSLRERLQKRQFSGSTVDAAQDAIMSLEGITSCNVYINTSLTEDMLVGTDNILVKPMQALCVVQGYNENIVTEFFNNLIVESVPSSVIPARRLLQVQTYTTHSGQEFQLAIAKPLQIPAYVTVYFGQSIDQDTVDAVQSKVCELASTMVIGQTLSSSLVLDMIKDDFSKFGIEGATVGKEELEQNFRYVPNNDEVWVFSTKRVRVVSKEL